MEEPDLYNDLNRLGERYSGAYLVNKFFIRILTDKYQAGMKGYDQVNHTLTVPAQMELQKEYFVTLFHEYVHYVHEISTMAGITQFFFELVNRKIFTGFVNLPKSSAPDKISGEPAKKFREVNTTIQAIRGGSASDMEGQFILGINKITINPCPVLHPFGGTTTVGVPVIHYAYGDQESSDKEGWAYFGKYFLYEGLAHHLDQLVADQRGKPRFPEHQVAPEYRLMHLVAQAIFPGIDETSMLHLASLALSYPDCGHRFIATLQEAATVPNLDGYVMEIHNDVNVHLLANEANVNGLLEKIKKQFVHSTPLAEAINHLCDEMAKAYHTRINNPVFELDVTFQRRPEEMAAYVVACDMVYEFRDEDEYLRDFAGTYLKNNQLADDLKTFLCHMDYYQTSINHATEQCCPLFTFCPQRLRREKPEQCRTQPRLSFEDREAYDYCNYSYGVAYMKAFELKLVTNG